MLYSATGVEFPAVVLASLSGHRGARASAWRHTSA
jgi:hypothetical protein